MRDAGCGEIFLGKMRGEYAGKKVRGDGVKCGVRGEKSNNNNKKIIKNSKR